MFSIKDCLKLFFIIDKLIIIEDKFIVVNNIKILTIINTLLKSNIFFNFLCTRSPKEPNTIEKRLQKKKKKVFVINKKKYNK